MWLKADLFPLFCQLSNSGKCNILCKQYPWLSTARYFWRLL